MRLLNVKSHVLVHLVLCYENYFLRGCAEDGRHGSRRAPRRAEGKEIGKNVFFQFFAFFHEHSKVAHTCGTRKAQNFEFFVTCVHILGVHELKYLLHEYVA